MDVGRSPATTLHYLWQWGELALRSGEHEIYSCPSTAAALRRAGFVPHLSYTEELALVAGTIVNKGRLPLLCPEVAWTWRIRPLFLFPSSSEAVGRADSRIMKAVELAKPLTNSMSCTYPGQHSKAGPGEEGTGYPSGG